jgi:hypothetical protein
MLYANPNVDGYSRIDATSDATPRRPTSVVLVVRLSYAKYQTTHNYESKKSREPTSLPLLRNDVVRGLKVSRGDIFQNRFVHLGLG